MLVFKHEVLLTFVGRLTRDREFCEWFASQPSAALASHGLATRDLEDLATILRNDRQQREVASALQPTIQLLLDMIAQEQSGQAADSAEDRLERLKDELRSARERLAIVRSRQPRRWWKFW